MGKKRETCEEDCSEGRSGTDCRYDSCSPTDEDAAVQTLLAESSSEEEVEGLGRLPSAGEVLSRVNALPESRAIAVDDILLPGTNARKITKGSIRDLAASIGAAGVCVPLIVRPHPRLEGKYELVAGERRLAASRLAGLEFVPANVRYLDEASSDEVRLLENWERVDLEPLEEASVLQHMIDRGISRGEIARITGRSVGWVACRANLVRLVPRWVRAIRCVESGLGDWPVTWLEHVALHGASGQLDLLAEFDLRERGRRGCPRNLAELRRIASALSNDVSTTLWDDAALPLQKCHIERCDQCFRRSDRDLDLFAGTEFDVGLASGSHARCLDIACWQRKMSLWIGLEVDRLRAKYGEKLILLSEDASRDSPDGTVAPMWAFEPCGKRSPGARYCLVIDGSPAGHHYWAKETRPAPEGTARSSTGKENPRAAAIRSSIDIDERRERLLAKREKFAADRVRIKLGEILSDRENAPVRLRDEKTALALVAAFGTFNSASNFLPWGLREVCAERRPWEVFDALRGGEKVTEEVWLGLSLAALPVLGQRMGSASNEAERVEMERLAGLLALDIGGIRLEAEGMFPEPKSWGNAK